MAPTKLHGITFYNVNKKAPENKQQDLMKENLIIGKTKANFINSLYRGHCVQILTSAIKARGAN